MEIIGKYNTAVIYADTVDSGAEGLINAFCNSPVSEGAKIRIMPDVHSGKGCAVGTTITVTDKVVIGLVGTDIGCGISAIKIQSRKLELNKLDKLIHEKIPSGSSIRQKAHRFAEQAELDKLRCLRHIRKDKALDSIGSLGGGNHFIELDVDSEGYYWLVIHSGSRNLGAEAEKIYHEEAFKQSPEGIPYEFAYAVGSLKDDYLNDMEIVQTFAEINRQAIADEIIKGMKFDVVDSFSAVHNYIDIDSMILRKGAVSAKKGERIIIPLNMRDGSLICTGKGSSEWNFSAPHGAGRLMSRQDAMRSFTLSQFKKEMKGIYSSSIGRETLDESPMAYKPAESIAEHIKETADIVHKITPVYNFKAGREDI